MPNDDAEYEDEDYEDELNLGPVELPKTFADYVSDVFAWVVIAFITGVVGLIVFMFV